MTHDIRRGSVEMDYRLTERIQLIVAALVERRVPTNIDFTHMGTVVRLMAMGPDFISEFNEAVAPLTEER